MRDILHPDCELVVPDSIPYGGTFQGVDAVIGWFTRELWRWFDEFTSLPEDLIDAGDRIVVPVHVQARAKNGKTMDVHNVWIYEFSEGKLIRGRERWIDREMAIPLVACEICDGGSPVLDYHDLMKHSVLARQAEIEEWEGIDLPEAAKQLAEDKDRFEADLEAADLPRPIRTPAWRATHHLDRWIGALETLAEDNED